MSHPVEEVIVGFFGLRRPKWKHPDLEIRLRGVAELGDSAQGTFTDLALTDQEPRVRAAAAGRVSEPASLSRLSIQGDEAVRRIARERLSGAAERLLKTQPLASCGTALETVNDQKSLAELALSAGDAAVRAAALAKILGLATPSQALLSTIAIQDAHGESGLEALARIDRRNSLRDIARKAKHPKIREAALVRASASLTDEAKPSADTLRRARRNALEPLLAQATRLAVSSSPLNAANEFTALMQHWSAALAIADGVSFDPASQALVDRFARLASDISRKAEAEVQHRQALINRREALLQELSAMAPETATRAELTARWQALPAIDDREAPVFEERFRREIARLLPEAPQLPPVPLLSLEESAALEALSLEAEALSLSDDFLEVMPRWHLMHKRWLTLASPLPDGDPLKGRFNTAWNAFKTRRRTQREERDARRSQGLETLRGLAATAEALAVAATTIPVEDQAALQAHGKALRELQAAWKAVGMMPGGPARQIRSRFMAACDQAYGPVVASREAEDWERHRHLTAAQELIDRVTALAVETDLQAVIGGVKAAHQAWKKLGPLPRDRSQGAWTQFKLVCDAQFERARPWLAEQDAQRVANLALKQALIAEVTTLAGQGPVGLAGSPADLAARRSATDRVKAIQAQWREIGPVPREADRATWNAFRSACDAFYGLVREQDSLRRQEETANLEKKLALCQRAEEFASSAEVARSGHTGLLTPSDISRRGRLLNDEWRAIGHIPRAEMEGVRTRFTTAIDRIWATIREEQQAEQAQEEANLEKKLALIKEVEDVLQDPNPRWFKDEVKAIIARWNAIGPVPRARDLEVGRRFDDLTRQVLRGH